MMQEYEPKLKKEVFNRQFLSKYIYVLVIGLVLLLGVSYSLTFFVQNKSVATGTLIAGNLTITYTDRSINASGLDVPEEDEIGISEYVKTLTITDTSSVDGVVNFVLTRTSGLALTDMRYALVVNGAIQVIDDVPADGEILETAILGGTPTGETINIELRLWPKTTYDGAETTFVGELTPTISYLGRRAAVLSNLAGKYVNFNCDGNICEVWQIVKIENERLVLTRTTDYTGATGRVDSGRYRPDSFNPELTFNDDSMITSLSTDGLNVYLAKTVRIISGSGTQDDPYVLINNNSREEDKKVVAVITYKDGNTTLGTQNVYYDETNYVSQIQSNNSWFVGWKDSEENFYKIGDEITVTEDINLTAENNLWATSLDFDDTDMNLNCSTVQCALYEIADMLDKTV